MENKKIVIAGGSGFIGQEMIKYFGKKNNLVILTRQLQDSKNNRNYYYSLTEKDLQHVRYINWDGNTIGEWIKELEGSDLIINLVGATVNCRYNKKNKDEILNSRINAVKAIGTAIQKCSDAPKLWLNASSATIYRHAVDRPQDDYTGELGYGFSVQVCKLWEQTFYEQKKPTNKKSSIKNGHYSWAWWRTHPIF